MSAITLTQFYQEVENILIEDGIYTAHYTVSAQISSDQGNTNPLFKIIVHFDRRESIYTYYQPSYELALEALRSKLNPPHTAV